MGDVVQLPYKSPTEGGISVDEFLRRVRANGGRTTDGSFDPATFREGWGKAAFVGDKVHFWHRDGTPPQSMIGHGGQKVTFYPIFSECGLRAGPSWKASLFGGGNYPRCERCASKRRRCRR